MQIRPRSVRVDPGVLASLRKEAHRRRVGYQTLINEVLAKHIRKDVAQAGPGRATPQSGGQLN